MLKKILTASIMVLSATTAYAAQNYKGAAPAPVYKGEPPVQTQSCLLYGPYVGFTIGNRINYTGAPAVYNGIEGLLFLGYGLMNPYGMLALEVWGGDSATVKDYPAFGGESIKSSWTYGISFIPGAMVAQNLIAYLRVGAQRTHFRASNPEDDCDCNNGTNQNGWHIGVGGQSNIFDNLDLRGEYVYSQYKRKWFIGTPRSHNFNISLLYRFF